MSKIVTTLDFVIFSFSDSMIGYCRTYLMRLRSDYKDTFVEKHGLKLGLMSGFVEVYNELLIWIYKLCCFHLCASP